MVQGAASAEASNADGAPAQPYLVRGRVLFSYLLLSQALGVLLVMKVALRVGASEDPEPLQDALLLVVPYAILGILLVRPLSRTRSSIRRLLGPPPDAATRRWALEAGIGFVGLSAACAYAIHVPLSHVAPDLVQSWILDTPLPVAISGRYLLVAHAIGFLVIVVVAPMLEETLFRGLLLPAWAARWGTRKAVVRSSLLFALLHPDEPVGAFLLGGALATAYLRTGSLWLPFLAHAVNNLLVWIIVAADLIASGPDPWTLAEFRANWWQGLVGLLIGAPLLVRVLRQLPRHPARTEETCP